MLSRKNGRKARYVVFLRGINVGGHHKVPMRELLRVLESLGCSEVRTYLASGNASLVADAAGADVFGSRIESALERAFGFPIPTIVRTMEEVTALFASDPFREIAVTPDVRRYVTFFAQAPEKAMRVAYRSEEGAFAIIGVTDKEAFSVLRLAKSGRTVDAIRVLEARFGKAITTRNWNTIEKLIAG